MDRDIGSTSSQELNGREETQPPRVINSNGTPSGNRPGVTIDLTPQAKAHPLFPLLDYMARGIHNQNKKMLIVEEKQVKLEREISTVKRVQEELRQLMKEIIPMMFSLKENGFDAQLRVGLASLYSESLLREVSDEKVTRLVRSVLKAACQERYKMDAAIKYCKKNISVFRTEERRRVLGISPCQKLAGLQTDQLARFVMHYLKAPESKVNTYTKNLVILRRYARSSYTGNGKFYEGFKTWLLANYPSNGIPSPEELKVLEEEDKAHYSNDHLATCGDDVEGMELADGYDMLDEAEYNLHD